MQAAGLVAGFKPELVIADTTYDSHATIRSAAANGEIAVTPPKKNRVDLREFDRNLYKQRHLVENTLLHLKRLRGIATRQPKNSSSFVAVVQICCIVLWLAIS